MPARPYQLQCMLGWPGDGTDASCLTSYSVCWVGQETGLMPAALPATVYVGLARRRD